MAPRTITATQPIYLRAPIHDDSLFSSQRIISKGDLTTIVTTRTDEPFAFDYERYNGLIRPALSGLLVAARVLRLSVETTYTAAVLLHRYRLAVMSLSYVAKESHPHDSSTTPDWTVAACLYLACKSEEEPRRLRDVINCAHMIRTGTFHNEDTTVSSPATATTRTAPPPAQQASSALARVQWNPTPPSLDEAYWSAKATVVQFEQVVLRWLSFDVLVSHPHRAVVLLVQDAFFSAESAAAKNNNQSSNVGAKPSSSSSMYHLIDGAWQRLNDSVFFVECLRCSALALAVAAIQICLSDDFTQQSFDLPQKDRAHLYHGVKRLVLPDDLQVAHDCLRRATSNLVQTPAGTQQ